ncbi:MAG TPA: EAL domain-containing protein [Candidatus Limnocylindria bacterium]|jgi:diguanylate cyclase (GGDEF)-like protein/PAS domain S-box-containing protein|nr:EAL domain-containing protein [Candidatus Limnocylindria bacterium]
MSQTADRSGQREEQATPGGGAVSPRRLLDALREVALVATRAHTPSEVALVAATQLCRLLDCDDAVVRWWNPERDRLDLLADTRPDRSGRAGAIGRGEGAVGIAFASASPVVVEDYARWEHQVSSSIAVGSGVAVPLLLQDSAVGALAIYSRESRRYKETEVQLLALFAAQVAPVIEAALLRIASQRETNRVEASDRQLRDMLDAALDAHVVMDGHGRITEWNAQAEAMFGWRRDEVVGKELADTLIPPALRDSHRTALAHYLKTGDGPILNRRVELEALRKNGIVFPVELTVAPVGTADGPAFSAFLRDISERRQVDEQLRRLALHDALTGLPNRLLLYDRAEQAFAVAKRSNARVALLLMDLDGFKDINDAYGHHVGDVLLQEVSIRLRTVLRAADTVARLGGDEFAVLLPDTDEAGALAAAKMLRLSLDAPITVEGVRMPVASSVGVALFPAHGDDPLTLLRRADIAMYAAKRRGTGAALYEEGSDLEGAARLGLASDLRDALRDGQLHLKYQPVIDLATRRVCVMEALARWDHPRLGLVAPHEFIALAERSGLMPQLSSWALKAALTKARDWQGRGIAVAVNMAVSDLSDPTFPDRVRAAIAEADVAPSVLHLEVTESGVMSEPERILTCLERLRDIGVRLAIDDFGTGSSSLAYLHRLPIHACKIDRSFVRRLTSEASSVAIVRATIELAHALDLRAIAEGVEDAATLDLLCGMGCDLAQGFFISEAIADSATEAWLASSSWAGGGA